MWPAKIPFFGLNRQYTSLRDEILTTTDYIYSTGRVLDHYETDLFERNMARRCNRSFALTVNSATQGLIFAQLAILNSKPYAVLIPTISFIATLNSVLMNNYTPKFCEIDEDGLMDLSQIDFKLDDSIGAIMYVNLFGNTVDWDKFQLHTKFFNNEVKIIEDAAQSFGASFNGIPSGAMGDISVLSFDPTKNLPSYGSGGMILTDDYDMYLTCRDLKDNGKFGDHHTPGTNSKMSEVDCAQMNVKLKYFDEWQRRRTEIAEYYTQELCQYVDVPNTTKGAVHAWHKYVIKVASRHNLKQYLAQKGVETRIHYDRPLYEEAVGYNYHDPSSEIFVVSELFTRQCLSLPIYPELTDAEVESIASAVKGYYTD